MRYLYQLLVLASVLLLSACGGGEGCAGAPVGSPPAGCSAASTTPPPPGTTQTASAMTLYFTNSTTTFTPLGANNVTSTPSTYAVANVLDSAGAPLANQIVSFSTDNTLATLASAMALTDTGGRAWVRIQPASLTTSGAAILTATSTMAGQTVTASQGYQVGASNVALGTMTISPASVTALATAQVSVPVTVNSVPAAAGQVNVTMQAACGYFNTPGTTTLAVPTSSGGAAVATWHSESACGAGTWSITATATGAPSPSSASVTVAAIAPANILYSGATANTLVVSTSSSGAKQSTLTFQVVDATSAGMQNQAVTFSLDSASANAGVTLDTTTGTTNSSGNVQVIVTSGSLPTPISVVASLTATPTMTASSFGLVVSSGKPTQNFTSLSATKLNIQGYSVDGVTTTINLRTSDRMGNPPPVNTAVTFTTGYGSVGGSCLTDATGACSVTYTTGGQRPATGVVTILAMLAGEESFNDTNGNNIYDSSVDTFDDIGQPYRDDNLSGTYTPAAPPALAEQKFGTATGALACADPTLSVAGTCNGVWDSSTQVREQIRIGLSSDTAVITQSGSITGSGFQVVVGDAATAINVPPLTPVVGMGFGSTVSAAVSAGAGSTCALVSVAPTTVPNQVAPSLHTVTLNGVTCTGTGTTVTVTVTSPGGTQTVKTFGPL